MLCASEGHGGDPPGDPVGRLGGMAPTSGAETDGPPWVGSSLCLGAIQYNPVLHFQGYQCSDSHIRGPGAALGFHDAGIYLDPGPAEAHCVDCELKADVRRRQDSMMVALCPPSPAPQSWAGG